MVPRPTVGRHDSNKHRELEEQQSKQHKTSSKALEKLEEKMRQYARTVFSLNEYVEKRGRESDFVTLKAECGRIVKSIDATLRDAAVGHK